MEIASNETDPVIYQFQLPDGSRAFVAVGNSTEAVFGGQWSERRQGLETVRWQADGQGRIDYYTERVWADSAGIPRFLHAWIEASETGEISGAEALIQTLRSCDPRMCPAPEMVQRNPIPETPLVAETEIITPAIAPLQIEPVAAPEPTAPVTAPFAEESDVEVQRSGMETIVDVYRAPMASDAETLPREFDIETEAETVEVEAVPAIPMEVAPQIEPVAEVSDLEIQRSGMETIVDVFRAPLPSEAETLSPEVDIEIETEPAIPLEEAPQIQPVAEVSDVEVQRSGMETIVDVYRAPMPPDAEAPLPETAVQATEIEAEPPLRRRSGPVILTDDN